MADVDYIHLAQFCHLPANLKFYSAVNSGLDSQWQHRRQAKVAKSFSATQFLLQFSKLSFRKHTVNTTTVGIISLKIYRIERESTKTLQKSIVIGIECETCMHIWKL